MDRFVTRGAPLPTFTGLLKRTDEAKENKRKHPTPSNGSTSVSITYNTLPGACSKKSKFVTPTDVQGKKLPLSGLSLRGIHGCAAQRPKLAPLSREKDCVSSLSASRACEAGGDGYVSLSSDEDAGEPTSRSAHNGDDVRREGFTENMIVEPKPSSAAAEDSIDWDPPPAAVGEGSSDPLADIISARQVGMALYLRRTARLSSKKTLAECGPVYDTYQQSLAHAVARGARGCLGRPPLLTPSLLTTVLADRLAVLPHLAIVGPDLSPGGGGCCKIQFDSQGVLVAVGRMHGVLDVYDMDECLQVVNQSARDDIGKTDEGNSSSLLRVLEPVCRIVSARKTDIVGIAWIPRCARPPRQTHSNRQPPSQLYNDEDDAECLLAVTLANDPFVYLYDAESWMGRHFAVFEHADGRTHGGSNSSIMYIRSAASLRGGGGSQRAPQLHFILTGSWSGHIRMWNFNDFKRPLWTVPGDPLGAAEQLGCVVSLHCIVLSAEDAYREKKMSGGRKVGAMVSSRSSEIDPYAITDDTFYGGSTASRPASVDLQVVVSVTSRGVLCLWDISEENCRGNLPAFGCDAAYHPINLCRVDIISLLGGGRDAVVGVSVTSGLNGARAVIKFSSMSIICISLPDCRVIYCNRLIRCALGDEICNDVCVLPVGSAPVGSEIIIDVREAIIVRCFHEHAALPSLSAGGTEMALLRWHRCMESLPLGADDCSKAQCARFTLPGQVWSISTKFRERSNGHEEAFTVIEFSEDLTKYIGFTPSKSKYVWLQFQSGFDVSAGFEGAGMSNNDISVHQQRNYFNYLVEGELSETNKDLGQGPMYTVRSIMNNSIELYEDYLGPQVLEGYPLVQLRIGWPDHGGMVDLNPSPRNIDSITPVPQMHRFPQHCSRINVGDTTAPQTKLSSLVAHPRLPYVMCGFSNGDIRLISPHFK